MYSEKLYSLISNYYDLILYINSYKRAVDYFVKQIPFPVKEEIRLLDVGAGTGLYTIAILKRFPNAQIIAIDINGNMLNKLSSNVNKINHSSRVRLYLSDASKPLEEIERDNFELIISGGMLEYVDPETTIKNLTRYLKPGGFFFNSPVRDNMWGKVIGYSMGFKPYIEHVNMDAFSHNGFKLERKIALPKKYFPICMVKEGHLFSKIS